MQSALLDAPDAGFANIWRVGCDIERELNAANERIKLLEAVTNDPHALWANWLRGSVTLPVGIGDVREYQDRIKRLEEDSQRLNWLLNRGLAWRDCYDDWWKKGEWLYAWQSALETIDKAREAKL
jgi:hypothetical protein